MLGGGGIGGGGGGIRERERGRVGRRTGNDARKE